ncbi:MAG: hypothetical protein H7Y42_12295 [Chitinophagaceae bacterium]|nr:hypothetical protein [Chitinophagaceae bacterium]
MIRQYPHTITLTIHTGSTQDTDGNWTGGSTAAVEMECRAEVNSTDGIIITPGGTQIRYDWTVYMPLSSTIILPGTAVEVRNGATVLCNSTVKQFSPGQLNHRAWL